MPISPINIYSLEDITSSIPRSINTDITIPPTSPMTSIPFTQIISIIWFLVVIFILSYSFFNFNKFKKTLKTSYNTKDNIYQSDTIKTPFVLGILKPKIYIPVAIKSHEEEYILEHEKIHIKRYDYIIKLIFYITACIHWFNPLIWISYNLMTKDIEMSCDEAVISKLGKDIKKDYSNSLLSIAINDQSIINKLAFGSSSIKSRIKNILSYKKPKTIITLILIMTTLLLTFTIISTTSTPSAIDLTPNSNPTIIEIENNTNLKQDFLPIVYENYESLPDYSYTGDNIAKKIATEVALQKYGKYYKGQFNIVDAHIFDVYQEKNKIKIFANIHIEGFILSNKTVILKMYL